MSLQEICSKFAGGFVEPGSDCVVRIQIQDNQDIFYQVTSQDPGDELHPIEILNTVASYFETTRDKLHISVYGLNGGFDGSLI